MEAFYAYRSIRSTIQKPYVNFRLRYFLSSCYATNKISCYYTILPYRDISRSRNAANKIFCFHSSNRVYVQIYTTIVYSKSNSSNFYNSVSLESSLRNIPSFTLFRYVISYIVIINYRSYIVIIYLVLTESK